VRDELQPEIKKGSDKVEALAIELMERDPFFRGNKWPEEVSSKSHQGFLAQARYVLANYVPKAEAVKHTILPENLDALAEGLSRTDRSGVRFWHDMGEDGKDVYHNRVLSMLDAEVAQHDWLHASADFIVSGQNGDILTAQTEEARSIWSTTREQWPTMNCDDRRDALYHMFSCGRRILLDGKGGAK
jgi:hypothetical protein